MHIRLDYDIHTADTVEFHFFILIFPPVAHVDEVVTARVQLGVSLCHDIVLVQRGGEFAAAIGLDPGVVVI